MSSFERARRRRGRVLAVDDHAPFLAVLRDVVGATAELEVVGEAQSGEAAVQAARELEPDMVLMDVRMPRLGGIAAAKQIKASRPSTIMILISTAHPDELPLEADDVFADAVIWKSELEPRLLDDVWLRYRDQSSPSLLLAARRAGPDQLRSMWERLACQIDTRRWDSPRFSPRAALSAVWLPASVGGSPPRTVGPRDLCDAGSQRRTPRPDEIIATGGR